MLIDSHCHLDYPDFADELPEILDRARRAGVGCFLTICTRIAAFERVLALTRAEDDIFCSVGTHPHEAGKEVDLTVERIINLCGAPKVVGIGETGLDFHYEHSPREAQEACLRTHIEAARQTGLPLIVHSRAADAETIAILREEHARGPFAGLIHCFSAGREVAECALELGFYISLSGIITFKAAGALREIVKTLPLDRLLVETDAPYLAPVPRRGKRNEPSFVVHTARQVADLLGMEEEKFAAATSDNFFRLFAKIPPIARESG